MAGKDLLVTRRNDGGEITLLQYRVPAGFEVAVTDADDHVHVVIAPELEPKPKRKTATKEK
jgi:hypothetical protein